MNVLKKSRVYLAGNMENLDISEGWREWIRSELNPMGVTILSPLDTAFYGQLNETDEDRRKLKSVRENEDYEAVHEYMRGVIQKDLRLIDLADFVIVNLDLNIPTFGTTHELVVATQQKKPIFLVVSDKKKTPLWLLGLIKPKYIYNSLDEVVFLLRDIDCGRIHLSSDKWRLLIPTLR